MLESIFNHNVFSNLSNQRLKSADSLFLLYLKGRAAKRQMEIFQLLIHSPGLNAQGCVRPKGQDSRTPQALQSPTWVSGSQTFASPTTASQSGYRIGTNLGSPTKHSYRMWGSHVIC